MQKKTFDLHCDAAERGHENIEWSIGYAYHLADDKRDLPRVLLVGDSICNAYQTGVREYLEGRVNVSYWVSSYCVTSPNYLKLLAFYLDEAPYAVVHFNNGLHSLDTPTADWTRALERALRLIREKQPAAHIVWTTSTPVANPARTAKCRELNEAALPVIRDLGGIVVDDLFARLEREADYWTDGVHHKPAIVRLEAEQVVQSVLAAARLRPAPRPALAARLAAGDCEIYGIVHWGLNTFTDREWGHGDEDPALLAPNAFDADQIVDACKAGGLKGLVVVAKHHDGFCLWPTKTTPHNISRSPFRGGRGDYVREMADACRRHGLKFGVYVSPWDRNNPDYATPAYLDTYYAQIRELLGGDYGEVFEMWFDGANGGDGWYGGANERRTIPENYYRFNDLFALVRGLQPNVCIFNENDNADFRWPCNEAGWLAADSRATVRSYAVHHADYMSYGNAGDADGVVFHPCEADFPLRRGWFHHAKDAGLTKSGADLLLRYLSAVGNGGTMNIGIAPDRHGRLDEEDVRALRAFDALRRELFAHPVATGPFNVVVLREDVSQGELTDSWTLEAGGRTWASGTAVGAKRIRLLADATDAAPLAEEARLSCASRLADAEPKVSAAFYRADPALLAKLAASAQTDDDTETARWMTAVKG